MLLFPEFLRYALRTNPSADVAALHRDFDLMDENRNGHITWREFVTSGTRARDGPKGSVPDAVVEQWHTAEVQAPAKHYEIY